MNQDQVAGLVRTLLASLGGYFVGKGFISSDNLTAIAGLVGPLVAAVWSFSSKAGK